MWQIPWRKRGSWIAFATAGTVLAGWVPRIRADVQHNTSVIVCMDGAPGPGPSQARMLATQILAGAGVDLDWRTSSRACPPESIRIRLRSMTPASLRPGTLAYAYPYEAIHIHVFYDRIQSISSPRSAPRVLAHVMVHEITHVLQQINRHSNHGVMKAHWSDEDLRSMERKPLPFAEEDVELIRAGRARRDLHARRAAG